MGSQPTITTQTAKKFNMAVFYRILLPIMGIILFISFIFILFKSPGLQKPVLNVGK
jgi:hypothetical protein